MSAKLTKAQADTLAAIAEGKVYQRRFGYGAWRIQGASPTVVGRLIQTKKLAAWGAYVGDRVDCIITDAGRQALDRRS